jgi:hypothetical protein
MNSRFALPELVVTRRIDNGNAWGAGIVLRNVMDDSLIRRREGVGGIGESSLLATGSSRRCGGLDDRWTTWLR